MTDITTYAAAYLLLVGQPVQAPVPRPIVMPIQLDCQLPPAPVPANHIVVRWVGDRHAPPSRHEKGRPGHHPRPPSHPHHPRHDPGLIE